MTRDFRLLLLAAAVCLLLIVLRQIRAARLVIADSLFWFFFAAALVGLAIFPEIAFWLAALLGVESPVNLVYLIIIALLVLWQFRLVVRVSHLSSQVEDLAQQIALDAQENAQEKERHGR